MKKAFGQIHDDQRNFRNIISGLLSSLKGTLWINLIIEIMITAQFLRSEESQLSSEHSN